MEAEKDMLEAIAERLKDELVVRHDRLPPKIIEKLFAVGAAEVRLQQQNDDRE